MTPRNARREKMFWVIDQIMEDGKWRTAETIRDEYEVFPKPNRYHDYRTNTPTANEITGKIRTQKNYQKKKEGRKTLWKKISYTE